MASLLRGNLLLVLLVSPCIVASSRWVPSNLYHEVAVEKPGNTAEALNFVHLWQAGERNLLREELALREHISSESTVVDVQLLTQDDVVALNSLASTLAPVGITQVLAMAAYGLVQFAPYLLRMVWTCESKLLGLAPILYASLISAQQLLVGSKLATAESKADRDVLLELWGLTPPTTLLPTNSPVQPPTSDQSAPSNRTAPETGLAPSCELTELPRVQALLLFSSPKWLSSPSSTQRYRLRQLQSHDLEMRSLNRLLGGSAFHVVPAAELPLDLEQALMRVSSTRVLILSGHWYKGQYVAETGPSRQGCLVSGAEFADILVRTARIPEMILLNGCCSHGFGQSMLAQLSSSTHCSANISVVCCTTRLEDRFAARFCHELCERMLVRSIDPHGAFQQACALFNDPPSQTKFRMGDPADYIHSTHGEHSYDPQCAGCNPPVHGVYKLLTLNATTKSITELEAPAANRTVAVSS